MDGCQEIEMVIQVMPVSLCPFKRDIRKTWQKHKRTGGGLLSWKRGKAILELGRLWWTFDSEENVLNETRTLPTRFFFSFKTFCSLSLSLSLFMTFPLLHFVCHVPCLGLFPSWESHEFLNHCCCILLLWMKIRGKKVTFSLMKTKRDRRKQQWALRSLSPSSLVLLLLPISFISVILILSPLLQQNWRYILLSLLKSRLK